MGSLKLTAAAAVVMIFVIPLLIKPVQSDNFIVPQPDSIPSSITFRGGEARTGFYEGKVPSNSSATWSYKGEAMMQGSCAYWNRTIYFGTYDGIMHAVSVSDGSIIWNFTIDLSGDTSMDSTPAIDNGRAYFGAGDNTFYCVDATNGSLIWKFSTDRKIISSPLVVNDTVYFGSTNGQVYALNTTTGKSVWIFNTGKDIWSSPTHYMGRIYIGSFNGRLYAINAQNGKEAWNCTPGANITSDDNRQIYATPAIEAGVVYIGFGANGEGGVAAYDAFSGAFKWSFASGSQQRGSFYSSIAVHNGTVFAQRNICPLNRAGEYLYALRASDGQLLWKFKTGENNGGSSPSVADGKVVIGSYGDVPEIYVLDEKSGALIWNMSTVSGIYSSPTLAEDKIFLPELLGEVHVITSGLPTMDLEVMPDSNSLRANQVMSINFKLSYKGYPLAGATLRFKADLGKLSQESATTFQDGTQKVKYWAPDTSVNLTTTFTVTASMGGFLKLVQKITINIEKKPTEIINTSTGYDINWGRYTTYIGIIAVLAGFNMAVLVIAWRYRRSK